METGKEEIQGEVEFAEKNNNTQPTIKPLASFSFGARSVICFLGRSHRYLLSLSNLFYYCRPSMTAPTSEDPSQCCASFLHSPA
jgi:hypothetical protein